MHIVIIIASAIALVVLPIVAVRGLVQMYQDPDRKGGSVSSGVAGMMTEIDRVVRPSANHIIEAKEAEETQVDDIGGG